MSTTDQLLDNAKSYASEFDEGDLPPPPARKVAVVACMDARLDPQKVLGLAEGDGHVIRNAGGVVADDAIRSPAISQRLLGTEEDVRQSIGRIQASPFIPRKTSVRGFLHHVEDGSLQEVS
jgi:carbonic anhydrase